RDLYPADFSFEIYPQLAASVDGGLEELALLEHYPNPSFGQTTIHIRIPRRSSASLKIYDALGRTVKEVFGGMLEAGDKTVNISTKEMLSGEYTLELSAPELGLIKHEHFIVIE